LLLEIALWNGDSPGQPGRLLLVRTRRLLTIW